ncbi:hypothetical protein J3R82DRAFT_11856 [Butyriboletus roseoflavus]|nr:hypothetical protein J3R82DRAFT_11856 [Butyriboletus roseoflavus]
MPVGYALLPTQQPTQEADRELNEAFASDEEEEQQCSEAPTRFSPPETSKTSPTIPAVYDFERDFDYVRPPPGSPPRPSAVALPNDFGNSNGLVPSSPAETPIHRPSFLRRAVGAILPTHYTRLPITGGILHSRAIGGGTQNDGVFTNVTAKPSRPVQMRTDDGSVFVVPEETQSNAPPSYAAAQADAVPPYWETTVHAPAGLDTDSGMIIDDLPSGSIFTFVANLFTSFFFQFVGFLLTYLLHTTHAAKFGSRAGLGLTLIQYGFYSRPGEDGFGIPVENSSEVSQRSLFSTASTSAEPPLSDNASLSNTSREWLSFLLMTLGWFLLLSSLIGFWRVKHWEASIRATQARGQPTADEIEQDIATRRTLENAFHLTEVNDYEAVQDETANPTQHELDEVRLQHDLRSAGLL